MPVHSTLYTPDHKTSNGPSVRRWWTQEEDRILNQEVKAQLETGGEQGGRNWSVIAEKLPGRSNKDCRKRWTKVSSSRRKGTWSSAEDHLLRKGVATFGFQWTKIAEIVVSRHPDQCAKRWHHSLDPNVKRTPWTPEEDTSLIHAVEMIGRDWKQVGRQHFPSRSTTDIKNRYVILSRRHALLVLDQSSRSIIAGGAAADDGLTQAMDGKHLNAIDMLTPDTDLSIAATPYDSDISNFTADSLNMPFLTDILPYISNSPSTPSLPDVHDSSIGFVDNPGWAAFDVQLGVQNSASPGIPASSENESYHPSPITNGSLPDTPSTSGGLSASSTLVLEELQPETVSFVIDTLLKTKSKFRMRLYNTGL